MLGALLAWEHGNGRSHVAGLRAVAEAVRDRFTFDAALCKLTHSGEFAGLCTPVQGPWLPTSDGLRKSLGSPRRATWGEFLGDFGFRRPEILRERIGWWQKVMRECDISLVIADCAPCALMAARGLGIPSIATGTGYLTPPPIMETFPVLLPQYSTRIYDEAEIVETINSVVPEFGIPRLGRLSEIYACSDQLAFTLDMLDPYTEWRSQPLLPPMTGGSVEPASGGEEIFIYFSTTEKTDPALMEAVGKLGVPVRLLMLGIDDATAEHFTRLGVQVERSPLPVDLLVRRTRMMVNAAQHGTLCIALAAGLPQVSVPQQLEQQYSADAAASRGVLRSVNKSDITVDRFRAIVLDAYEDATMARRAADLAGELRHQFEANQRKLIRRRIAAVMDYRL
jgi:UDP:flavonoid glycosyltransferase YjiC (YdhE family)